jgi:hypothetical protein
MNVTGVITFVAAHPAFLTAQEKISNVLIQCYEILCYAFATDGNSKLQGPI